jgi:hypothetical protein
MDIDERIQNLSARLSTTTDPALKEELQKELQELLNQKFSKKERVLKRDEKDRFAGEKKRTITNVPKKEKKEVPIKKVLVLGQDVFATVFRIPDQKVREFFDNVYIKKVGTSNFFKRVFSNVFMKEFRNNEQLKALVQNKCNVQVKTKVLLYREQPFEGAEQQFVLQFDEVVLYDPNFRRREYLVQSMDDLKKVLEKQAEVITERISKFFNMNHSEWIVHGILNYEIRIVQYQPDFNI